MNHPFHSQSEINKNDKNSKKYFETKKFLNYQNRYYKQKTCPISMVEFNSNDIVTKLECDHIFLKESIEKWVKNSETCPLCKATTNIIHFTNMRKRMFLIMGYVYFLLFMLSFVFIFLPLTIIYKIIL